MSRFVIKQSSRVIKVPKHSLFLSLFQDMSYDLTGLSFFFKNRMSRTILNKMCMLSTSCCTSILLVKFLSLFSLLVQCAIRKGSYGGCYATLHPISCHMYNTECSNTTHDCSPVLISFCVTDPWYMDGQLASFHAVTR